MFAFAVSYFLLGGVEFNSEKCVNNKYNPSNISGGSTYVLGKCYVPFYEVYTSTEKCGTFGIVCRETEPYVKMSSRGYCFRLKDGTRC